MKVGDDRIWPALPMPAVMLDQGDLIAELNPAAEYFLNAPEKLLQGRQVTAFLRTDSDLAVNLARARADTAPLFLRDVTISLEGDRDITCDLQLAPLGEGSAEMLILLHPRQIVGQLGRALKVQTAARTAIGLADMLAHEIKNPLAGITGAAQLLAMNLGQADRELTDLILEETRRIVDLLAQVEQFGDLRKPDLRPLNIHDVLERARRSACLGAASGMRFRDQYDPSLPYTLGDAGQLAQVFANLFANAAEAAGPNGGNITIRSYYEPGLRLGDAGGGHAVPLQVEVTDDGPGISPNIADSLFQPFVSSRENGTGLGLALVSKIISDHNGTIGVTSRPGVTTFRISLPIAPAGKGTD